MSKNDNCATIIFYREDVEHALGAGMNRHLAKPVEAGSLMNALREFLIEE